MRLSQIINIVTYKAYAELKAEISRTYLGLLWWLIEPVLYMLTFYYLFSVLFDRGGEGFIASLIVGLVVWKWFGSSVQTGAFSIYANRGLIQQVYIPKVVFPLSVIAANTLKFLVVFTLLIIFINILGYSVEWVWWLIPIILFVQLLFIVSITLLLSVLVSFFPDGKYLVENCMMLLMFLSGVFFEISELPESYQAILYLNPMAVLIDSYKQVFLLGVEPDWGLLLRVVLLSFSVLAIALTIHVKLDKVFAKVMR